MNIIHTNYKFISSIPEVFKLGNYNIRKQWKKFRNRNR